MPNSDKIAYTAAQVLAIRTVTGNKVSKNLLNVPLSQIPTEIDSIVTGTTTVEAVPEWWEAILPTELLSGTLYTGTAPNGNVFFSTSLEVGLWKLDKTTREFTHVIETGAWNRFQNVGNNSFIITSSLASTPGIVTYYNDTVTLAYDTGYNWSVQKIVGEVAFLWSATNAATGMLQYETGYTSLVIDTGYSFVAQDYSTYTFFWCSSSYVLGIWQYEHPTPDWNPVLAFTKIWEYNWGWVPYIDADNDVFMLGSGDNDTGGILVWENDQFYAKYSGSYYYRNMANTYKYSNELYFIPGDFVSKPLQYNKTTGTITTIGAISYLDTFTLLPNNWLSCTCSSQYNGVVFYDITNQTAYTYYSGYASGGAIVLPLEDGVCVFTQYSSIVSSMRMWYFDYATMTQVDLVATYGFTLTTTDRLLNSTAVKGKVFVAGYDATTGIKVYDETAHTFTKISSLYVPSSQAIRLRPFLGSTEDYILDTAFTSIGSNYFYVGVQHYKYSTDALIEIVPANVATYQSNTYMYEKLTANCYIGWFYKTGVGMYHYDLITTTATQINDQAYSVSSTYGPFVPNNSNKFVYEIGNMWYHADSSASSAYRGIYQVNLSTGTLTKPYTTTSTTSYYYQFWSDNFRIVYPSITTFPCLYLDSTGITELGRDYYGYTYAIAEIDNKVYFSNYDDRGTAVSNRGIVALDLTTKTYSVVYTYGSNYNKFGRIDYDGITYFVGDGWTFDFTNTQLVAFNSGIMNSSDYVGIGQYGYFFLQGSGVSDLRTKLRKVLFGFYESASTYVNVNVRIGFSADRVLYGEII